MKEAAYAARGIPLQERINRQNIQFEEEAPGAGESLYTIFQGAAVLAKDRYPLWYLENVLTPLLEQSTDPDGCLYDELAHKIVNNADLCLTDHDRGKLLYGLMIAPFCYLEELRAAQRRGPEEPDGQDGRE